MLIYIYDLFSWRLPQLTLSISVNLPQKKDDKRAYVFVISTFSFACILIENLMRRKEKKSAVTKQNIKNDVSTFIFSSQSYSDSFMEAEETSQLWAPTESLY